MATLGSVGGVLTAGAGKRRQTPDSSAVARFTSVVWGKTLATGPGSVVLYETYCLYFSLSSS